MSTIAQRLHGFQQQIRAAEQQYHRPDNSVQCLAVSKQQDAAAILQAFHAGQTAFAENYLQEACQKQEVLQNYPLEWHFIGRLQSNKCKIIAKQFAWVHTVTEIRHAQLLAAARCEFRAKQQASLADLNICIQVNVDQQSSKNGVAAEINTLIDLAKSLVGMPGVKLRGLMTVPALQPDFARQKQSFLRLTELWQQLNQQGFKLDTLSIGMSQDYRAAIAAGSTLLRIGTAIFGKRI